MESDNPRTPSLDARTTVQDVASAQAVKVPPFHDPTTTTHLRAVRAGEDVRAAAEEEARQERREAAEKALRGKSDRQVMHLILEEVMHTNHRLDGVERKQALSEARETIEDERWGKLLAELGMTAKKRDEHGKAIERLTPKEKKLAGAGAAAGTSLTVLVGVIVDHAPQIARLIHGFFAP